MEPVRYGLLRAQDIEPRITTSEGREPAGALSDSHNPSPVYAKARAAAFEKQSLAHETDCAAYYIANGPFEFPVGSVRWTLRSHDRTRAETLTLSPLPARSVRELLKAGIINTSGVIVEAWRAEVERLRL
jgi:hypothetical protein